MNLSVYAINTQNLGLSEVLGKKNLETTYLGKEKTLFLGV